VNKTPPRHTQTPHPDKLVWVAHDTRPRQAPIRGLSGCVVCGPSESGSSDIEKLSGCQLMLDFIPPKETQAERCRRILKALPRGLVVPASELRFDYDRASTIATRQEADR